MPTTVGAGSAPEEPQTLQAEPMEPAPTPGAVEPERDIYLDPQRATARVGDVTQFTAWFCDVPEAGSPFGADEVPLTEDDTCRKALQASWSASAETSASLAMREGPKVLVTALAAGTDVVVTAERGTRQGSATLTVLEPGEEPLIEVTEEPEPADIEPAATPKVGPLLGTIGFRSAAIDPGVRGVYVTTNYAWNTRGTKIIHDPRLQARRKAKTLLLEMGFFRAGVGKFKLLADNGRWVALDRGAMRATANTWNAAWALKAVPAPVVAARTAKQSMKAELANAEVQPLVICLEASKDGKRGLLKLDGKGLHVWDRDARCGEGEGRTLFMTDDLPAGADVSDLLKTPGSGVDAVTKARFAPPDLPAKRLTASQRKRIYQDIDTYFKLLHSINRDMFQDARIELGNLVERLSVTAEPESVELPEEINWLDFSTTIVAGWVACIPLIGPIFAAGITQQSQIAQVGIILYNNANLAGPRVIEGVTNRIVGTSDDIDNGLKADRLRTLRGLEDLQQLLLQGCDKNGKCSSDRRLAQWAKKAPVLPRRPSLFMDRQVYAYLRGFYELLLPVRGNLTSQWTYVPNDSCDRAFTLGEVLLGVSGSVPNFNTNNNRVVAYTSVWKPWANEVEVWDGWWWEAHPQRATPSRPREPAHRSRAGRTAAWGPAPTSGGLAPSDGHERVRVTTAAHMAALLARALSNGSL